MDLQKNARENVDDKELATLQEIAAAWLSAGDQTIANALAVEILQEIGVEK